MDTSCIFCKIVAGEIRSHTVYEDEEILAFLDINPVQKGHTLVIPKEHYTNIHDTPEKVLHALMSATQKVAGAIKEGVGATGLNIHINNEHDAGQIIFHTHIHIIPRFKDDGLEMWKQHPYPEGVAEDVQEKIRASL